MRRLLGATVAISALTLVSQCVVLATQIVIASTFGATRDLEAYLAAATLPLYVTAVLMSGLGFVLVPVFVSHQARGEDKAAWTVASNVLLIYGAALCGLALIGVLAAEPLLRYTVPGLSPDTLQLAARLAVFLWPTIVLNGLISLLTGLHHAREHFRQPAISVLSGGLVSLVLLIAFARHGAFVLAFALLASTVLQCVILLARTWRRFVWPGRVVTPETLVVLRLVFPLLIGALFGQAAQPIERFVSSHLPPGTIAHLNYANRISTSLAALLAGSVAVTIFPTMSRLSAMADRKGLSDSLLTGLRATWLLVAPAIAIGMAAARPGVAVLFERGEFLPSDTQAVAGLLPWYLISLIGIAGGNITARVFFALKSTRTVAVLAVVELVSYAVYAPLLAGLYGGRGLAMAIAAHWSLSILLQSLLLRRRLPLSNLAQFAIALLRVSVAAALAGVAVAVVVPTVDNPVWSIVLAGLVGSLAYLGMLWLVRAQEWEWVTSAVKHWLGPADRLTRVE